VPENKYSSASKIEGVDLKLDRQSQRELKLITGYLFWSNKDSCIVLPSWNTTKQLIRDGAVPETKIYKSGYYPEHTRMRHVWNCAKGWVCGAMVSTVGVVASLSNVANDINSTTPQWHSSLGMDLYGLASSLFLCWACYSLSMIRTQDNLPKMPYVNTPQFRFRPIFRGKDA